MHEISNLADTSIALWIVGFKASHTNNAHFLRYFRSLFMVGLRRIISIHSVIIIETASHLRVVSKCFTPSKTRFQ